MPPKRRDKFRKEHSSKLGLEVTSLHSNSGVVAACACRFCLVYGREEKFGEKRNKTERYKYFENFRTDHYLQHLRQQHPIKWSEYEKLESDEEREQFFKDVDVPFTHRFEAYFEREGVLRFLISKTIVEEIVGELLFHPDDLETCTHDRALGLFKLKEHVDGESDAEDAEQSSRDEYVVEIKTAKRFSLVIGCVALGSSFRMAARMV
jgi:hypothetical protein